MSSSEWFRIGHTTRSAEASGCTAIVFDRQVPAAVDVRGGAPGTRETTLLDPGSTGKLDAILLSGGSAYGLQAAGGVMRYLAEQGRGVETRVGTVPLVSAAIIFDLGVGSAYHPTEQDGYSAATAASGAILESGRIGAGAGASVAKLGEDAVLSGLGVASIELEAFTVTAVVVLNAVGDIYDPATGRWLATCGDVRGRERAMSGRAEGRAMENTTIGAVLVSGELDRRTLNRCCVSAQAALARCTVPAHTMMDGDTFFAASSGLGTPTLKQSVAVTSAVEVAVERAIVTIFEP